MAHSLERLREQINLKAPGRNRASDGTIGDTSHENRRSDHNPWVDEGVVTALDITHDEAGGCHAGEIIETIRASRDPRIKYLIWNRQICSSLPKNGQPAWAWRHYDGPNAHSHHFHISVLPDKTAYDSTADWTV